MQVTADARPPAEVEVDLLAVPVAQLAKGEVRLPARTAALDRALGGRIAAVLESGDFRGKAGQTLVLYPEAGCRARRVLLVGLGEEATQNGFGAGIDVETRRSIGAKRARDQ